MVRRAVRLPILAVSALLAWSIVGTAARAADPAPLQPTAEDLHAAYCVVYLTDVARLVDETAQFLRDYADGAKRWRDKKASEGASKEVLDKAEAKLAQAMETVKPWPAAQAASRDRVSRFRYLLAPRESSLDSAALRAESNLAKADLDAIAAIRTECWAKCPAVTEGNGKAVRQCRDECQSDRSVDIRARQIACFDEGWGQ